MRGDGENCDFQPITALAEQDRLLQVQEISANAHETRDSQ